MALVGSGRWMWWMRALALVLAIGISLTTETIGTTTATTIPSPPQFSPAPGVPAFRTRACEYHTSSLLPFFSYPTYSTTCPVLLPSPTSFSVALTPYLPFLILPRSRPPCYISTIHSLFHSLPRPPPPPFSSFSPAFILKLPMSRHPRYFHPL